MGSPLWSIVDGPWKLSAFNADGHVTFVPNKSYSGPVKPRLAAFEEVPFTTDAAEYDVLQSPSSSTKIDVGYLPSRTRRPSRPTRQSAPTRWPRGLHAGPAGTIWGINYYVVNYQSTTGNGPIFKQLYFRQALAYLMNQAAVIAGPLRGYGTATVGPVANTPATSFLSPKGKQGDPFPYNPAKAKCLLTSHGWTVVPNGVTTCANPSLCGPGIKKGQGLSFNFPYATGISWIASEMTQLQSNAATVGIKLNLEPEPFNQVTALAGATAWSPSPRATGTWRTGAAAGRSRPTTCRPARSCSSAARSRTRAGYCDPANDATDQQDADQRQPELHVPLAGLPFDPAPGGCGSRTRDYQLTEVANNLKGVTPQSPTLDLTRRTGIT